MNHKIYMDGITKIAFSHDIVQLFNSEKASEGPVTPVNSREIESTGEYHYLHHDLDTGKPSLLMGFAPEDYFEEIDKILKDSLFDEKRARSLEESCVGQQSRWAHRFF